MLVVSSSKRTSAGIPASTTYDGVAELPRLTVDTTFPTVTGTTRNVTNDNASGAGSMAQALSDAVGGDEIVIATNLTRTITLPNRGENGWVLIRSDNAAWASSSATRVTAATNMRTVTAASGGTAVATVDGAHHYRFVGIEFVAHATVFTYRVCTIGDTAETSEANLPSYIIFDRCYIHGDAEDGCRSAIQLDAKNSAVINCYIFDVYEASNGDNQTIWASNTPGPLLIHNNYLAAAGENVMFGGQDPAISNCVPSDITITQNYFIKPLAWKGVWQSKNLLEFKNAQRVRVLGNVFENCWSDAQAGFALLITPRNQNDTAPWCVTQDISISYNKFANVGQGINIAGVDDEGVASEITRRVQISNNLISVTRLGAGEAAAGKVFQTLSGAKTVSITHNTCFITVAGGAAFWAENNPVSDVFKYNDNISSCGNGWMGTGTGTAITTLSTYFTNAEYTNNALIGWNTIYMPANNFAPASNAAVGFVDFDNGDFTLDAGSSFKDAASDGEDIGIISFSTLSVYAAAAVAG